MKEAARIARNDYEYKINTIYAPLETGDPLQEQELIQKQIEAVQSYKDQVKAKRDAERAALNQQAENIAKLKAQYEKLKANGSGKIDYYENVIDSFEKQQVNYSKSDSPSSDKAISYLNERLEYLRSGATAQDLEKKRSEALIVNPYSNPGNAVGYNPATGQVQVGSGDDRGVIVSVSKTEEKNQAAQMANTEQVVPIGATGSEASNILHGGESVVGKYLGTNGVYYNSQQEAYDNGAAPRPPQNITVNLTENLGLSDISGAEKPSDKLTTFDDKKLLGGIDQGNATEAIQKQLQYQASISQKEETPLSPFAVQPAGPNISVITPAANTPLTGSTITAKQLKDIESGKLSESSLLGIAQPTEASKLTDDLIGGKNTTINLFEGGVSPATAKQQRLDSEQAIKDFIGGVQKSGRTDLILKAGGETKVINPNTAYKTYLEALAKDPTASLQLPAMISLSESLNISDAGPLGPTKITQDKQGKISTLLEPIIQTPPTPIFRPNEFIPLSIDTKGNLSGLATQKNISSPVTLLPAQASISPKSSDLVKALDKITSDIEFVTDRSNPIEMFGQVTARNFYSLAPASVMLGTKVIDYLSGKQPLTLLPKTPITPEITLPKLNNDGLTYQPTVTPQIPRTGSGALIESILSGSGDKINEYVNKVGILPASVEIGSDILLTLPGLEKLAPIGYKSIIGKVYEAGTKPVVHEVGLTKAITFGYGENPRVLISSTGGKLSLGTPPPKLFIPKLEELAGLSARTGSTIEIGTGSGLEQRLLTTPKALEVFEKEGIFTKRTVEGITLGKDIAKTSSKLPESFLYPHGFTEKPFAKLIGNEQKAELEFLVGKQSGGEIGRVHGSLTEIPQSPKELALTAADVDVKVGSLEIRAGIAKDNADMLNNLQKDLGDLGRVFSSNDKGKVEVTTNVLDFEGFVGKPLKEEYLKDLLPTQPDSNKIIESILDKGSLPKGQTLTEPIELFHATTPEKAKTILTKGPSFFEEGRSFFLAPSLEEAQHWGETILKFKLSPKLKFIPETARELKPFETSVGEREFVITSGAPILSIERATKNITKAVKKLEVKSLLSDSTENLEFHHLVKGGKGIILTREEHAGITALMGQLGKTPKIKGSTEILELFKERKSITPEYLKNLDNFLSIQENRIKASNILKEAAKPFITTRKQTDKIAEYLFPGDTEQSVEAGALTKDTSRVFGIKVPTGSIKAPITGSKLKLEITPQRFQTLRRTAAVFQLKGELNPATGKYIFDITPAAHRIEKDIGKLYTRLKSEEDIGKQVGLAEIGKQQGLNAERVKKFFPQIDIDAYIKRSRIFKEPLEFEPPTRTSLGSKVSSTLLDTSKIIPIVKPTTTLNTNLSKTGRGDQSSFGLAGRGRGASKSSILTRSGKNSLDRNITSIINKNIKPSRINLITSKTDLSRIGLGSRSLTSSVSKTIKEISSPLSSPLAPSRSSSVVDNLSKITSVTSPSLSSPASVVRPSPTSPASPSITSLDLSKIGSIVSPSLGSPGFSPSISPPSSTVPSSVTPPSKGPPSKFPPSRIPPIKLPPFNPPPPSKARPLLPIIKMPRRKFGKRSLYFPRTMFYTNPSDPLRPGVILAQGVKEYQSYSYDIFKKVDVELSKSRKRNQFAGLDQPQVGFDIGKIRGFKKQPKPKSLLSKNFKIRI